MFGELIPIQVVASVMLGNRGHLRSMRLREPLFGSLCLNNNTINGDRTTRVFQVAFFGHALRGTADLHPNLFYCTRVV